MCSPVTEAETRQKLLRNVKKEVRWMSLPFAPESVYVYRRCVYWMCLYVRVYVGIVTTPQACLS